MRFNKLDLNLLVALDAVLTERNVTRAAERVHLSQSSMSNALARLRDYFEDELLVQIGRKMELTSRGLALQDAVRDVLVRIDTSIAAPPQFDCTKSDRQFTIFISDYSMAVLMPQVLALAARQRSTVRFRFLPQISTPARALERGDADLMIIPKMYCSPDHPTELVFTEDFVCVVWNESAIARNGLTPERYAKAGHVVMQPVDTDQPSFENWFAQQYGHQRRIEVLAYSFAALPFLVVGTELLATVHTRLARLVQGALPVSLLPMPLPMPTLEQDMQWHKYRSNDPGLVWLRSLISHAAALVQADTSTSGPGNVTPTVPASTSLA